MKINNNKMIKNMEILKSNNLLSFCVLSFELFLTVLE